MCLYPPSMRRLFRDILHSDNDIGLGKRLATPDFSWPDSVHKKKKKFFYARLKNLKRLN